ncbi:T-cell immunomodulatory protein like protein [Aduncisulcus paluster]|uniref:T-cell immunomodulatory protein like protein n=1 Tax=Aduncisulcus paluster TaxID=2918883 RepID=A0ABQ5KP54_9EUKA|nr:T-cell immunomodulatory protein like protein [Aduncisulcus paluster]
MEFHSPQIFIFFAIFSCCLVNFVLAGLTNINVSELTLLDDVGFDDIYGQLSDVADINNNSYNDLVILKYSKTEIEVHFYNQSNVEYENDEGYSISIDDGTIISTSVVDITRNGQYDLILLIHLDGDDDNINIIRIYTQKLDFSGWNDPFDLMDNSAVPPQQYKISGQFLLSDISGNFMIDFIVVKEGNDTITSLSNNYTSFEDQENHSAPDDITSNDFEESSPFELSEDDIQALSGETYRLPSRTLSDMALVDVDGDCVTETIVVVKGTPDQCDMIEVPGYHGIYSPDSIYRTSHAAAPGSSSDKNPYTPPSRSSFESCYFAEIWKIENMFDADRHMSLISVIPLGPGEEEGMGYITYVDTADSSALDFIYPVCRRADDTDSFDHCDAESSLHYLRNIQMPVCKGLSAASGCRAHAALCVVDDNFTIGANGVGYGTVSEEIAFPTYKGLFWFNNDTDDKTQGIQSRLFLQAPSARPLVNPNGTNPLHIPCRVDDGDLSLDGLADITVPVTAVECGDNAYSANWVDCNDVSAVMDEYIDNVDPTTDYDHNIVSIYSFTNSITLSPLDSVPQSSSSTGAPSNKGASVAALTKQAAAVHAVFFDVCEQGIFSILVSHLDDNGQIERVTPVFNNFRNDGFFVRIRPLNGLCVSACKDNTNPPYMANKNVNKHNDSKSSAIKPLGPVFPGVVTKLITSDMSGKARAGVASLFGSAALPGPMSASRKDGMWGLGRIPQYIDQVYSSYPMHESEGGLFGIGANLSYHAWQSVIPNSRVFTIPYPRESAPGWSIEVDIPFPEVLPWVILTLAIGLILIGIIVIIAHVKEKKLEQEEKDVMEKMFAQG